VTTWRDVREVLRLGWEAGRALCLIVIALITTALLSMVMVAVALKLLIDATVRQNTGGAVLGAGLAAVALVATVVWLPLGSAVSTTLQERTGATLDRRLMSLTARLPTLEMHDRTEFAERLQSLTDDDRASINGAVVLVASAVAYLLLLGGTGALLAAQQPLLGAAPLALLPLLWVGWRADQAWERARQATASDQVLSNELFRLATSPDAAKELRVFDTGEDLIARHEAAEQRMLRLLDRASWRASALRAGSWLVFAAGYTGAVLVVAQRAAEQRATAGDVVLVITLGLAIVLLASGTGLYVSLLSRLGAAGGRLRWLTAQAAAADARSRGATRPPAALREGLRLHGVGFSYAEAGGPALRDVDLDLPAGTVVALVGENGAGKSTLVKLLCGLYAPTSGRITVDGVDLQQIAPREWQDRLCAGFQDFVQFEFTAATSVGVGDLPRQKDPEALRAAVRRAGTEELVAALPHGWDTALGRSWTDGAELSTGQWQKIALARGLMREDPLLVVLDEPTAALDPVAENQLFRRFAGAASASRARGAVTVLVSHRFSTVRFADRIVVVGDGTVLEVGSHDELMSAGGLYAELYRLQRGSYK
jgi:ATP-binding cassette subfamily B protein